MATLDELLAQARASIPDVTPQIEAQRLEEIGALDKQRAYQAGLLKKQLEDASQQAYITREMQRRDKIGRAHV